MTKLSIRIGSWVGCCLACCLQGCTDAAEPLDDAAGTTMQVQASVGELQEDGRALVLGTSFMDGATIGVTVNKQDGGGYVGVSNYNNVAYTCSASGTVWNGAEMKLTDPAKAVAYYPYDATTSGMNIPVFTTDQVDYMYSGWVNNLSASFPTASFQMKHGLAAIRIKLTRGDYNPSKPCQITSVGAVSMGFGTSGSLNIGDGTLSGVGGVGELSENKETFTLPVDPEGTPKTSKTIYLTAVPKGGTNIEHALAKIVVDGITFTAPITMKEPFRQGMMYCIELVANNTFLGISTVYVIPWTEDTINGSVTEQ